ncbi:MAG: hypothetical protein IJ058_12985 [Lachnospiraceae bacterium]|nr:hypothetical protein [Lachnospiraceae bacterium]
MSGSGPVLLKIYDPADHESLRNVDRSEVMRYGGMMMSKAPVRPDGQLEDEAARIEGLIDECAAEALPKLSYRVCYRYIKVERSGGEPVLPFDTHGSVNFARIMEGCTEAVMMAATIGMEMDRLIARYNRLSPTRALIMQALGAERVEALCDLFNDGIREEMAARGLECRPRFSPGYGDLPLEVQKEFMVLLDCSHLIGITLNESLIMSPSKSVTAVIGCRPV